MSDDALIKLADEAGLLVRWHDAEGRVQKTGPDTLRAVLRALELPADSPADVAQSRTELRRRRASAPMLIVARTGELIRVPQCRRAEIVLGTGIRRSLHARGGAATIRAPRQPGYYGLECDGERCLLAVAPARCLTPQDLVPHRRLSGISVQTYSLRGGTSGAFGDFAALGAFAKQAGRLGFDAVMASPSHAQFGAEPGRFTPYSPSTRLFLNPLFADATLEGVPARKNGGEPDELIDWSRAGPAKFDQLRAAFARFRNRDTSAELETFCREGGERLLAHSLFEALDAHFRAKGLHGFRNWPAGFESPSSPGVRAFARAAREELQYQLFLQWLAAKSASRAHEMARRTMAIGIIADIAVGMDPEGSHAWSAPNELLGALYVGAPPDAFNSAGQNWGLTTLSPGALERSGFAPFIATIRAAMRHAGGVRIDHVMALRRLWVVPAGASPTEGVYLRYPERELLYLLALESHRHRAIVIGEDLGTVPAGFRDAIADAGILGTQVLWFERNSAGRFLPPGKWRRDAVATTTTHDLATVAGWWSGTDMNWRSRARRRGADERELREARAADRAKLWSAFRRAKCASGESPAPARPGPVLAAALAFVARSRSTVAFAPLEDLLGDREQPNLPGTTEEHPNWRRRVKDAAPLRRNSVLARTKVFLDARNERLEPPKRRGTRKKKKMEKRRKHRGAE